VKRGGNSSFFVFWKRENRLNLFGILAVMGLGVK